MCYCNQAGGIYMWGRADRSEADISLKNSCSEDNNAVWNDLENDLMSAFQEPFVVGADMQHTIKLMCWSVTWHAGQRERKVS